MKRIVQIFTGGWQKRLYAPEEICARLAKIIGQISLDAVIIGWNTDRAIYEQVGSFLKEKNIAMYLWMPVFSELHAFGETDPVIDLWGRQTGEFALQEGESFAFQCPTSEKNRVLLSVVFERNFADCSFDGVFLDKIRSQSFVTGAEHVLGCCCPRCAARFAEQGVDLQVFKEQIDRRGIADMLRPACFDPSDGFHFADPQTEAFFRAKCAIYTQGIQRVTSAFRARGLKIGMDVYAPALARLVGQDIDVLLPTADFIKPMMYRKTQAPAGISFEYRAMQQSLPGVDFNAVLGAGRNLEEMSDAFLAEQLRRKGNARLYPGIEVNYREDIARTDAEYVRCSAAAIRQSGCGGIVCSWDVMLAPDAHLAALTESADTRA